VDNLIFTKCGTTDAIWGSEDFISRKELANPDFGFIDIDADEMLIELNVEVYGDDSLASRPITKAIEEGRTSEHELIALADADIETIRKAIKSQVTLEELSNLQDKIIHTLRPESLFNKNDDDGKKGKDSNKVKISKIDSL
jgi:hypothetical protein